ncbi:MAG: hypothetical protein DMG06_28520 [Acidobacteria bacterium]|nr:MAG: hypothetical protein DMG06_28520 [Acidobacteriota bacterium]
MRAAYPTMTKVLLALLLAGSGPAFGEEDKKIEQTPEKSAPEATSKTHVRLGGISVGGSYRHYSNLNYYPYYYPAFFGPSSYYWWPYYDLAFAPYHPGFYNGFARSSGMGEVKLQNTQRGAEVFIDGAYAGFAEDLKSIWLDPGAYELEVKATDSQSFKKRIYVLSGKTVRIVPALRPETGEVK